MWPGSAHTGDGDNSVGSVGLFESCWGLLKAGYSFPTFETWLSECNVILDPKVLMGEGEKHARIGGGTVI